VGQARVGTAGVGVIGCVRGVLTGSVFVWVQRSVRVSMDMEMRVCMHG